MRVSKREKELKWKQGKKESRRSIGRPVRDLHRYLSICNHVLSSIDREKETERNVLL